ncbi:MAG: hypothetical protein ACI4MA_11580 [Treponema sp.]
MKLEKLLIGVFIIVALSSCGLMPFEDETNSASPEQTNISEESSLFEKDEQNKIFTFETNDTKYLGTNGWTLWTVPNVNATESFGSLTVEAVKESGRTEAGFGLVFCEQKIDGKSFMLAVLINANGYYTVGKVSDGVFCHINDGWKNSNYINKGYGIKNTIAVSYDEGSKNFLLKINGYEIASFTVSEQITFKNSRSGFAVVIANNENFPANPVRVTFKNK